MTNKKENWFTILLKLVISLFGNTESTKEVEKLKVDIESGKKEFTIRDALGAISEDAKDVIIEEGAKFVAKNGQVLLGLSDVQREYAVNLAYLSAVKDLDELSIDELMEYRELITKVAELGPELSEQLHAFWEEFQNTLNIILDKVVEIGIKAGAIALKAAIPALLVL